MSAPVARDHRVTRLRGKPMAVLAALATAALLLTGCAAGQRAQTAIETPVLDGVGATVGSIDLRAVTITTPANGSYPSGGTATLQLYIVNGGSPDQLVSVSSPAAKSAALFSNTAAEFPIPSTTAAPTPSPTPTPTPSTARPTATATGAKSSTAAGTTAASSTSAAPTSSTPAPSTSASEPPVTIPLPSGETTVIGVVNTNPQITLSGLTTALFPAMSIPITFTFANAGSVTVVVAVHLSTGAVDAPTLAISHATTEE